MGLAFPSPLGLAAGFDKDATTFKGLATLGFGFIEVGTVTAQAQEGNGKPRIWRSPPQRALVNRMGFPNPGAEVVARRLARRPDGAVVGVNIGKTKRAPVEEIGADYRTAVRHVLPFSDYLVLNVSSPNTPGLRAFQAVELLAALVADARCEMDSQARAVPLLVKIGPDLADREIDAIADLAVDLQLDGIVAVNTMLADAHPPLEVGIPAEGGISGAPLKTRAMAVLERLYGRVGDRIVLISVGGIEGAQDAWERLLAGATLVQAHTGFIYGGPRWPHEVNEGLLHRLEEAGMASIQEAIGAGAVSRGDARSRPRSTSQMSEPARSSMRIA